MYLIFQDSKLHAAPFNNETLFADEVQPALWKLESHKQSNKPVNVHVSVLGDTKTDRRPTYKPRDSFHSKKHGLFISHGPRTRTRTKTSKPRSSLTRTRAEGKETLTPNPIIETEDIDNQTPDKGISRTSLFFSKLSQSSRGKIRKVLEGVVRSWHRPLGGVHHKRRIQPGIPSQASLDITTQVQTDTVNTLRSTQKFKRWWTKVL